MRELLAADEISPADHNRDFAPERTRGYDFTRDIFRGFCINSESAFSSQGFAGELQKIFLNQIFSPFCFFFFFPKKKIFKKPRGEARAAVRDYSIKKHP